MNTRLDSSIAPAPPEPVAPPAELRHLPHWVMWRAEPRTGKAKPAKVPYHPTTGRRADVSNPSTWGTYAQASAAAAGYDGVGFVLTPTDPFTAIDLDGCRDSRTGAVEPWAQEIVDRFSSYTEISPSGTGLHIWLRATLPPEGRRKGQIELYNADRFITVTGHALSKEQRVISDRHDDLPAWHDAVFAEADRDRVHPEQVAEPVLPLADREVLERALAADNGAKVQRLYQGDTAEHGDDHSRADLALISILSFWTRDRDQLDRLFRGSGLYRRKWDQRRGRATYGERTIARALATLTATHNPHHGHSTIGPVQGSAPEAEALPTDVVALQAMVREELRLRQAAEAKVHKLTELESRKARMMANGDLGQERLTAVVLASLFANWEMAGDAGVNGLHRAPLASLAERTGYSENTAGTHVTTLAKLGLVRKQTKWVHEEVDRNTGEIKEGHRVLLVGPPTGMDALAFAEAVAAYAPTTPKRKRTKPNRVPAEDMQPQPPVELEPDGNVNPKTLGLGKTQNLMNIVDKHSGCVNPKNLGLPAQPSTPPPVSHPVGGNPLKPGLPPNSPDPPPPVDTPRLTLVPAEPVPAVRLVRGRL